MIVFKTKYNRAWDINGLKIACGDDIEDWDYELKGTYEDNLEMLKICLRTVFLNPDKRYKLFFDNIEVCPNTYDEDKDGVIKVNEREIVKYCVYKERIISFCLYGEKEIYLKGALQNVKQFKNTYPDATCYFYVRNDTNENVIKSLEENGAHIIKCVNMPGYLFRLTRFLACENIDNYFMSRDVDCRLNEREIASNNEWLESDKNFHLVRDHPEHGIEILAGLWGCKTMAKLKSIRFYILEHLLRVIKDYNVQCDQYFLKYYIYPLVKSDTLEHDEFFNSKDGQKINHERKNNEYIGEAFDENENYDQSLRDMIK